MLEKYLFSQSPRAFPSRIHTQNINLQVFSARTMGRMNNVRLINSPHGHGTLRGEYVDHPPGPPTTARRGE